jgi:chromosome segregation ATPase
MSIQDKASVIKADYQSQLDKLEELKASLAGKLDLVDSMVKESDDAVAQAKLDGIEEGKAMIQLPDPSNPDNQYTQQQMNDAVNAGQKQISDQLQPQIDSLNAEKADLQSQLDAAKQAQADAEAKLASDEAKIAKVREDVG